MVAFSLLAATYWTNAEAIALAETQPGRSASKIAMAGRMQIAAGACVFVTSLSGWWIFFAIMLAALDFPFQIPVGDLSTMIRGYSEKSKV